MSSLNTNAPDSNAFKMKDGECCNDPQLCCYACFCPCFVNWEVAKNIGEKYAWAHCLATCCGSGCSDLTILGEEVALKRKIPMTISESACQSCFNICTCYSCKVLHESRLYRDCQQVEPVQQCLVIDDRGGDIKQFS